MTPYPLWFEPLLKPLVWGGQRLRTLGKSLPPGAPVGESWELVDLPNDQSIIKAGPWAGRTLQAIVAEQRDALMGPVALDGGRFPLLVKYIDAAQTLSVQVHPDEEAALRLGGRPKNEAWYILHAEPDAKLYLGLREGVDAAALRQGVEQGALEPLLREIRPRAGDLVSVRPGTLHAIGAGVLLAEVQQPSDTTYRVYDWGRLGLDGKPREMHVAQALGCTRLDMRPSPIDVSETLDAGHFRAAQQRLAEGQRLTLEGQGPLVLVGLGGQGLLASDGEPLGVGLGRVVLVPHACRARAELVGEGHGSAAAHWLVVSFPTASTSR